MKDIYVVVPSYNPDIKIMKSFINDLKLAFNNIVIVNDGSNEVYNDFFSSFQQEKIIVIKHVVNQGKGRAMKTAFNYLLENRSDFKFVVTADCDGQHTVEDIKSCARLMLEYPDNLILGVRDFNKKDIPSRSRFGNKLTRSIFKMFIGLSISDTQSGLRGFNKKMVKEFLGTTGEKYEYETNMLITCKEKNVSLIETEIQTLYIDGNESSHFNPIRDSILIYKSFLKYIIVAMSSFLVDIMIFQLMMLGTKDNKNILLATIGTRIFSSILNFILNGKLIFNHNSKASILRYFCLVIIIMMVSGYSVSFITNGFKINALLVKVVVDTLLFLVSYLVQREWVFKNQ